MRMMTFMFPPSMLPLSRNRLATLTHRTIVRLAIDRFSTLFRFMTPFWNRTPELFSGWSRIFKKIARTSCRQQCVHISDVNTCSRSVEHR